MISDYTLSRELPFALPRRPHGSDKSVTVAGQQEWAVRVHGTVGFIISVDCWVM